MDSVKIQKMSAAGKILSSVLEACLEYVKPGISELDIDKYAEKLILKAGAFPGFKKVPGYHHTICVAVNDVVVHGIPTNRVLAEGDIIGIDCGVYLDGYHTDMAQTIIVTDKKNNKSPKLNKFLQAGEKACFAGIKQACSGNRVGHISQAIQKIVEGGGYSVVRSLVGHGVGRELHEEPEIPGYLSGSIDKTPKLTPGMTIAVEVIYNEKKPEVVYSNDDDWTISTKDRALSGLFERTILIGEKGPEYITKLPSDPAI